MRRGLSRFANLIRGEKADREMAREMEAHLALLQEDFERQGLTPEEARLAAKREYGGIEQAKELHRAERSFVGIEQFFKDVRYGWANLMRNPGFTLTAVIALALGIGVNATIFGIYNAVALKPLPIADPDRVVRIGRWFAEKTSGNVQYNFAYPEYQYLRDHSSAFSAMAAASQITVQASIADAVEHLNGYVVSANYFADLGVKAHIGRTLLADEDLVPGANPVVVLDFRFWQRKYRGDPNVLGQPIKLNGSVYTIIGVAPREFTGTESFPLETAFWAPFSMIDQLAPSFGPASNPGWREQWRDSSHPAVELLARLKPGVSRAQAQAETNLLIRRYLSGYKEANRTMAVTLQRTAYFGLTNDIRFHVAAAVLLLFVSLVLLVACANVANMLLARGVARQREIGIRLALGASRGRVIQQLLTEGMLLALLGGAAGVLLSLWAGRILWRSMNTIFDGFHVNLIELNLSPDIHVLTYGLAVCLLTGALFGLAPALLSTRMELNTSMKYGSPSSTRAGWSKLRGLLLGAQVAVSVLLLVFGFAMAGTLPSAAKGDPGFDTHDTYALLFDGGREKTEALRERLETMPELSGAAIGEFCGAPIGSVGLNGMYTPPMAVGKLSVPTLATYASDGYLETLGIRILRGRNFTRQEVRQKVPVAVISESTSRHFWPGEDPLGKRFSLDLDSKNKFTDFEVVGVAGNARFANITEVDPSHVYLPLADSKSGGIVFRIRGDRGSALGAVRSAVEAVDPGLTQSLEMVSLESGFVGLERQFYRVAASLAGILTLVSLTLAGIGIYGVEGFLVSQQTREIGIRAALGATSGTIITNVVLQGLRPVFIGMAIGFTLGAGANLVERATEPFPDPLLQSIFGHASIYAGLALMLAIAVIASIVPARRALRVDPMVALRHE
jgi:putative ABC transport system permease protein